jgi:hypothetical protein
LIKTLTQKVWFLSLTYPRESAFISGQIAFGLRAGVRPARLRLQFAGNGRQPYQVKEGRLKRVVWLNAGHGRSHWGRTKPNLCYHISLSNFRHLKRPYKIYFYSKNKILTQALPGRKNLSWQHQEHGFKF